MFQNEVKFSTGFEANGGNFIVTENAFTGFPGGKNNNEGTYEDTGEGKDTPALDKKNLEENDPADKEADNVGRKKDENDDDNENLEDPSKD